MLTRFHKILIGMLATQIVLAVIVMTRGDDTAALDPKPILATFDAAQVTRVQVASATGKPVDLVKRGDAWVLASSFDYPVVASKVTDLLSSVAKLSAATPIATQATRHKQLHVADDQFERKLTVTAGGKDTTLVIGSAAGARRNALRIAGDSRVFAVSGLAPWSIGAAPRDWVDTSYARVPVDEIAKVTIQRGTSSVELAREKAGAPWAVTIDGKPLALAAGESLDTGAIEQRVGEAASIDLVEPADPKRTSPPTATITIERIAANTSAAPVVIDVVEDGTKYWVHQRGVDRAVLVEKTALDGLVTLARDGLVKRESSTTQSSVQGGKRGGAGKGGKTSG